MMDTPEQEISSLQEELKDIKERLSIFLNCCGLWTPATPEQIAAHNLVKLAIDEAVARMETLKEALK